MNRRQKELRTITVTLSGLQVEALHAFMNITEPSPCFVHDDDEHGDFRDCDGYAEEFQDALWIAFDTIFRAWESKAGGT